MIRERLGAAPLTRTDWGIFLLLAARRRCPIEYVLLQCLSADNRDADLVLRAQEIARFGPAAIQLWGIDCRGWTLRSKENGVSMRLRRATLTPEDWAIWESLGACCEGPSPLDVYLLSDRSDAEFMLWCLETRSRAGGFYRDNDWIDFSGTARARWLRMEWTE